MAHAGTTIEHALTGQRMTFVRTAADTGGALLQTESSIPAAGAPRRVRAPKPAPCGGDGATWRLSYTTKGWRDRRGQQDSIATMWTSPTLRGERVLLRPLGLRDADGVWADVQDRETRRLTGTHRTFTYEEIVAYCASRAVQADRITLAIADPRDGTYRGEIVLNDHDEPNRSAGLRILLSPGARGRGLGAEALRLVLAHAFGPLGLHRVSLEVYDFNERAVHVYEKVGFRHEGRMRDALWWEGTPHDALLMAALATEWEG